MSASVLSEPEFPPALLRNVPCRCVMVPIVTGVRLEPQRGEDEFEKLTVEDQQTVLGQKKLAAYQAGKLKLSDLIGVRVDRRWGLTRYEQGLKETL